MGEMGKAFPEIKKRLIDERDVYLAQKLRAVAGRAHRRGGGGRPCAGHVEGDPATDVAGGVGEPAAAFEMVARSGRG